MGSRTKAKISIGITGSILCFSLYYFWDSSTHIPDIILDSDENVTAVPTPPSLIGNTPFLFNQIVIFYLIR